MLPTTTWSTEDTIRFCETAVNKCDDKPVLEKSTKWMKAIVAKDPDHENLAVYARLLLKTGNKQQALEIMKKAVETGKKVIRIQRKKKNGSGNISLGPDIVVKADQNKYPYLLNKSLNN